MSKPPCLVQLRCSGSNQDFNTYAGLGRPDSSHVVPCPVCSKPVKLMAKYRKCATSPARVFSMIPTHNRKINK